MRNESIYEPSSCRLIIVVSGGWADHRRRTSLLLSQNAHFATPQKTDNGCKLLWERSQLKQAWFLALPQHLLHLGTVFYFPEGRPEFSFLWLEGPNTSRWTFHRSQNSFIHPLLSQSGTSREAWGRNPNSYAGCLYLVTRAPGPCFNSKDCDYP